VLQARVAGDPDSVLRDLQRRIAQAEPGLIVERASTIEEHIGQNLMRQRLVAYITVAFGTLALVMACLGLYGAIAYAVSRRTAEIGLRIAVGARPSDVLRLIMSDGLRIAAIGLGAGLALAVAAGRIVGGVLFGITPSDAGTYFVVVATLLAAATLATAIPARRAARVDPMTALRTE
jgi:ABC-type antimicrobial peptide transport system permease subunit